MYPHEGCTCSRTSKQQQSLGMLDLGLIERLEGVFIPFSFDIVESLAVLWIPLVQRFHCGRRLLIAFEISLVNRQKK